MDRDITAAEVRQHRAEASFSGEEVISTEELAKFADYLMRERILNDALTLTLGDRNKAYGSPVTNMQGIAALWNEYIRIKVGHAGSPTLTGEDVAIMNALQKIARAAGSGETSLDTFTDMAAYAAIAGECHVNEGTSPEDRSESSSPQEAPSHE